MRSDYLNFPTNKEIYELNVGISLCVVGGINVELFIHVKGFTVFFFLLFKKHTL